MSDIRVFLTGGFLLPGRPNTKTESGSLPHCGFNQGAAAAAVLEYKTRDINTPEVREALDVLEPHVWPEWLIPQFRHHLERDPNVAVDKKGQQQVLRETFPGIRESVKDLLRVRMDTLTREFAATQDRNVKAEIGRLRDELAKLDQPWAFRPKRRSPVSLLLHFLKRVRFRSTISG